MKELDPLGTKVPWGKFLKIRGTGGGFLRWRGLGIAMCGVTLATLFSGLSRPLWIDEFLHFALASQTWPEVWNYIILTSGGTNHGQTWFYQVLSIFLLDFFGAGFVGLRLVSWISTFVLLVSTYYFLRLFAVRMGLRLFVVGLVLVNRYFSFEMGNGRAYMLLVATTALTAYGVFSLLSSKKTGFSSKVLFGVVVTIGALNHPYFPVILGALVVGFFLVKGLLRDEPLSATFWTMRVHLVLTVTSGLLGIVVGQLTWLRESPDFSHFDPFEAFKKYGLDVGVAEFSALTAIFVLASIFSAFWVVRGVKNSPPEPRLLIGSVLVLVGISLSLFFTWISIWRNYWIFPRQWLSGAFLVFVGFALLAAVLFAYLANMKLRVVGAIGTSFVWVAALMMIAFGSGREIYIATENRAWWDSLSPLSLEPVVEEGNRFWVIAGNLNIKCDDTVWPELARYYDPSYSPEVALEDIKRLASSCEDSD